MPQRNFVTHPLVLRELTVARVTDVNDRMRRVTLTGAQLQAFTTAEFDLPAFVSDGFDDHVKLVFALDGDLSRALPVQRAHSIDWTENIATVTRDYTPRRFDAALGELDLDFVRHGDGPAATWAEQASIGDVMHIVGPKSSVVLPNDVEWMVLAGDETALPAIGRYLDEYRGAFPVIVVVEVDDESGKQGLTLRNGDELHWVQRPSDGGSALHEAVASLALPEGTGYVWAAAESRSLLPLRRWCTRERGMPKTHVNITGYWHAEVHNDQAQGTDGATETPAAELDLDQLLSPAPWFVARAALSSGVFDAIAMRPQSVAELSVQLGLHHDGVAAMLQVLTTFDAVTIQNGVVSLGAAGEAILEDEHLRESLDDTTESALLLSLAHLDAALRTGTPTHVLAHGGTPTQLAGTSAERARERVEAAIGFDFVARGVVDLPTLAGGASVAVTGPGAVAFSTALGGKNDVSVVGSLVDIAAAREAQPSSAFTAIDNFTTAGAEVAACALALAHRTDSEAVALLNELAATAQHAVVVELLLPLSTTPTDHDAEHTLLAYAATGSMPRDAAAIERLAAEAGWTVVRSTPLGWDHEAFELRR